MKDYSSLLYVMFAFICTFEAESMAHIQQNDLINYLINKDVLKNPHIIQAFKEIDRADFIRDDHINQAYEDGALPIGHNQTISQPTVVAMMLEMLEPKEGEKILDIGFGSGWTTALIAHCVGPSGLVYATELEPNIYLFGKSNLDKYNLKNVLLRKANLDVLGLPDEAPFDRILISAAAEEFPVELISQFTKRMVIPINNSIWVIDKNKKGQLSRKIYEGFVFVPLLSNK